MAIDIGKPEAAALIEIIEPFVIDAEEVEDRGLKIVNVDRAGREGAFVGIERIAIGIGDVVAIIVGTAIGDSGLNAAPGQP